VIKSGVQLGGLVPQMALAYAIASKVYELHALRCVITSACDGEDVHKQGSLHFQGRALDLRAPSWYGSPVFVDAKVRDELRVALGEEFDVILEEHEPKPGVRVAHIHVEWDPKQPVGGTHT
jgi:hypothetical protein